MDGIRVQDLEGEEETDDEYLLFEEPIFEQQVSIYFAIPQYHQRRVFAVLSVCTAQIQTIIQGSGRGRLCTLLILWLADYVAASFYSYILDFPQINYRNRVT